LNDSKAKSKNEMIFHSFFPNLFHIFVVYIHRDLFQKKDGPMGINDEELVNLCLSGDKNAFGELVMHYQRVVYGLTYHLVGNFEDARDLSQEAFIKAYTRLSHLRDKTKFASWLKKITFSVCMNWLKARGRSEFALLEKEINEEDIYNIPDPAPPPPEQVEAAELREAVLKAVNKLPETYRLPLTLFHFDGLSYQKVAESLSIPVSTVKWRLHQARRILKKEMSELMEKPATRFEFIGLELDIAGCPNSCRHCGREGSPPCGELMSFDDAKWVVEQFRNLTKSEPPVVKGMEACLFHEPTVHPDFLSLWEYCAETYENPAESVSVLSTNGYGIAHADDYRQMLKRLRELGTETISSTLHGLEEQHDWFVRRKGAFRDIFLSAERAAEAGLKIHFNIYLDRRNMKDFARLLDFIRKFEENIQDKVSLSVSVPTFAAGNQRLRVYESSLRPRLSDFEMFQPVLEAFWTPPYDRYTESHWTEKILNQPTDPSLKQDSDPECSDGEGAFILAVDRFCDVYQLPYNFDWAPVKHGNLKTDGLAAILDSMEAWRPPQYPDIITLTEKYGDRKSTLIHRYPLSVQLKWIDNYWRDKENAYGSAGASPSQGGASQSHFLGRAH